MPTAQATTGAQLTFPEKGSLRRHSFPRLLRDIARGHLTGSLYLLSGDTKKVVFFEDGQPVFVRSNVLSECLGQILTKEGLITQEQCDQTLEAIRRTGKKQGELLVEMGILSEGNLRYGLAAQLRAKLFDIFSWDDGRYQFKRTSPAANQQGIRLRLSAEGVILSGIVERYSEDRALEALRAHADKYPVTGSDFETHREALDLLPEELYFAQCLDGSRTVEKILQTPTNPPVPTPAAFLYGCLQAGVIQLSDVALPARPRPTPPALDAGPSTDEELAPQFEAQDVVTEYEDTPLPGELPRVRGLLGDHEDDFMAVEEEPSALTAPVMRVEVSEELIAAEPDSIDETFDVDQFDADQFDADQIELSDEEVEIVPSVNEHSFDDLRLAEEDSIYPQADSSPSLDGFSLKALINTFPTRALIGLDELHEVELDLTDVDLSTTNVHQVDLGFLDMGGETLDPAPDLDEQEHSTVGLEGAAQYLSAVPEAFAAGNTETNGMGVSEDAELRAAICFNEGETALRNGDYAVAATKLEEAFAGGFDVAELHAMLAYARFMASDHDDIAARRALELLEYAESMDPNQDVIFAYRGAIYRQLEQLEEAREALRRALELNPYCELALEHMTGLE